MGEINEGVMDVVACELRLGPGENDVYRYRRVMPEWAWEQLNEHGKIACKEVAIDIMLRELNEFVSARREVHRILTGLEVSENFG